MRTQSHIMYAHINPRPARQKERQEGAPDLDAATGAGSTGTCCRPIATESTGVPGRGNPAVPIIQQGCFFSLYLLARHGATWLW